MKYGFGRLSFDIEDGVDDHSVVQLQRPDGSVLSVAREPKAETLEKHVDASVAELLDSPEQPIVQEERSTQKIGDRSAVLVRLRVNLPRQPLVQEQAYVVVDGDVVAFTLTAPAAQAAQTAAAMQQIVRSLRG